METETEDVKDENSKGDVTDEKPGGNTKEKTFTQKELDRIVLDRIAQEKRVSKTEKETLETEKLSLKEVNEKFEAKLKELIAPELEAVDEEYRELLERLPLLEQVEFINKLNSKKTNNPDRKFIPKTQKSNSDGNTVVGVEPVGRVF